MNDLPIVRKSKQFGVTAEREKLADYLRRVIRDKDLSYRKVAQRSGGRVSHATISDIINGRQKDIKTETLIGIAKGLGVPEEEIFAVARGATTMKNGFEQSDFARLYFKHGKLTKARQKEFERIWKMVEADYDRTLLEQEREKDKKGE
jgi:transcriptional regulator with XRE-family HTH domain